MISITNFDVGQGDCLLLHFESFDKECKKLYFNILIDGGYAKENIYREIKSVLQVEVLNGIVVTHIDGDHIAGIIEMISASSIISHDTFIIFNKYDESVISYKQGRKLADMIKEKFNEDLLYKSYAKFYTEEDNNRINSKFDRKKNLIVNLMSFNQRKKTVEVDEKKVNVTMLWPDNNAVKRFMRNWHDDKIQAEIINKSSVTLLIEFMGHVILMPGDAYFTDIAPRIYEINPTHIDIIKASHHGAKDNNMGLINVAKDYKCKEILFTIKEDWDNLHPDFELIENLANVSELSCSTILKDAKLKGKIATKDKVILKE